MQMFMAVLTKGEYMPKILKHLQDHDFHGSVLTTMSIKDALLNDTVEPEPIFGGFSKMVDYTQMSRPMLFIVTKDDKEIGEIEKLVEEACDGSIDGKGFMYSVPVNSLKGV